MHNIMQIDEKSHAMFSVKETPWHKIGKVIPNHLTSEEAIKEAGLDWRVNKQPSHFYNPLTKKLEEDAGKYDLINSANGQRLGIVSNSYKIFQNRQAFEFMDTLVSGDYSNAHYETAGALGKGENIWAMIAMDQVTTIGKNDNILPYLVLTNNHSGKGSLQAFFTPIRVVCQNTLTFAINGAKNSVSIRHSGSLDERVREAQEVLGMAVKANEDFATKADILSNTYVSEEGAKTFFEQTFFPKKTKEEMETLSKRSSNVIDTAMDLFEGKGMGSDMDTARGTAWGLYNTVTEYLDHKSSTAINSPEKALKSNFNGNGYTTKNRAWNQAMELAL
jgi:phage/plasmid-like protein (TIGR03299 family)